jgi:hypothetical protein
MVPTTAPRVNAPFGPSYTFFRTAFRPSFCPYPVPSTGPVLSGPSPTVRCSRVVALLGSALPLPLVPGLAGTTVGRGARGLATAMAMGLYARGPGARGPLAPLAPGRGAPGPALVVRLGARIGGLVARALPMGIGAGVLPVHAGSGGDGAAVDASVRSRRGDRLDVLPVLRGARRCSGPGPCSVLILVGQVDADVVERREDRGGKAYAGVGQSDHRGRPGQHHQREAGEGSPERPHSPTAWSDRDDPWFEDRRTTAGGLRHLRDVRRCHLITRPLGQRLLGASEQRRERRVGCFERVSVERPAGIRVGEVGAPHTYESSAAPTRIPLSAENFRPRAASALR